LALPPRLTHPVLVNDAFAPPEDGTTNLLKDRRQTWSEPVRSLRWCR